MSNKQPMLYDNIVNANLHTVLYTRDGCHLCDQAKEILLRHGLQPLEVDIDADAQLHQRYTNCVPVIEINGKERFRGRVDERLLRRIVRAAR